MILFMIEGLINDPLTRPFTLLKVDLSPKGRGSSSQHLYFYSSFVGEVVTKCRVD
jgi:hypothetical protein